MPRKVDGITASTRKTGPVRRLEPHLASPAAPRGSFAPRAPQFRSPASPSASHKPNKTVVRAPSDVSSFGPPSLSSPQARPFSLPERGKGKGWRFLAIVVAVFVATVGGLHFLHRAWVSVTFEDQILQQTLSLPAALNEQSTKTILQLVQAEVTTDTVLEAQGTTHQESPARGKIEIRNYWSKNSLPLVRRSRFEDPNGTVFRTQESVEVPGYSQSATGDIVPGTTTVEVVADKAGPIGNIQKGTPLLLPAFEGKPQYDRMGAIATEDFTGGFAGEVPRVNEEALATLIERETAKIRKQASELPEVARSIPPGFRLAQQEPKVRLISHSFHPLSGGSARVSLRFSVEVYAFDPVAVVSAAFASSPPQTNILPSSVEVMINDETVTVSALARVALKPETIAEKTVGLLKEEAARQLSALPFAQETRVSIFPFWRQRLPARSERITVTVVYITEDQKGGGVDNTPSVR
ncbi:MAG: hypothetical protein KatS3mg100_427 [Candidatus Parcubacteria bacterium]|nr:MAG: hypothetical protein KatS3mg100_427 [Candidatus Parcubacteria bacterium]